MQIFKTLAFLFSLFFSVQLVDATAMEDDRSNQNSSFFVNSSIRSVPKAEEWKDNQGFSAPSKVIFAAERLWKAVENEGVASFDAEWGWRTNSPFGFRVFLGITTLGIWELVERYGYKGLESIPMGVGGICAAKVFEQRTQEMNEALEYFRLCVNNFVKEPATNALEYKVITVGQWIMDNRATKYCGSFHSVCRDMTDVSKLTILYVNSRGGWSSE